LHTGQPKIEQDPVYAPLSLEDLIQVGENAMDQSDPVSEPGQTVLGETERGGVSVYSNQPYAGIAI
jgi:hypothetical protein